MWSGGDSGQVWTCWSLSLIGPNARGTLVKDSGLSIEFRDASDVFMPIAQVFIAWVPQPLMPEKFLCTGSCCMHRDSFVDEALEVIFSVRIDE